MKIIPSRSRRTSPVVQTGFTRTHRGVMLLRAAQKSAPGPVVITTKSLRSTPVPALDLRSLQPHPLTGAVYVVAMPQWLLPLQEIYQAYVLNQRPWMRVIRGDQYNAAFTALRGQRAVIVNWAHDHMRPPPADRRVVVLPVYFEAIDSDLSKMLPRHVQEFHAFQRVLPAFDGAFAHTPKSAAVLSGLTGKRFGVLPAGVDERVLGTPGWSVAKSIDTAWYGTRVGRRREILFSQLGRGDLRWADIGGVWGRAIVQRLNTSKTVLYVKHTDMDFSSTWRTWQCISSSAAMVQEQGDCWPLSSEHCYEIPAVTTDSVGAIIDLIRDISPEDALRKARFAHEQLRAFSTRRCIDEYIVEQTAEWLR